MKILMKKGYHLEVVSWENDGDHYNTQIAHYETKEDALKDAHLCKYLFASKNSSDKSVIVGVGNTHDYDWDKAKLRLIEYQEKFKYFSDKEISEIPADEKDKNDWMAGWFTDIAGEHMGGSDFYQFRVCESVSLTYTPVDILVEEIKIEL